MYSTLHHSLRRTFITGLSNKMINARVIQKLARHSSLAITQLNIETNDAQLLKIDEYTEKIKYAKVQNRSKTKPFMLICNTVKGKGVSFMENNMVWHSKALSDDEYDSAINELRGDIF